MLRSTIIVVVMSSNRLPAIILLFSLLASQAAPACADELKIAVAANFADTLTEISRAFERQSDHRIIIVRGSTGKLYAQLLHGAPYDAFFAADSKHPQLLEEQGQSVADSRFSYAIGRLVLWSSDPRLIDSTATVLQAGDFTHLAIANPRLAPYGLAAQQFLTSAGRWEALQPKLVRGENINQAFQFVATGNAALGLVARSQLTNKQFEAKGSRWDVPATSHATILQQAVLIQDSDALRTFVKFVRSEAAQSIMTAHGYDLPTADE